MNVEYIKLSDGDGELHADGLPRLINVSIVFEGGKTKTFPYHVDRLSSLFSDLSKSSIQPKEYTATPEEHTKTPEVTNACIESRDTVRCVKIVATNSGPVKAAPSDLVVGSEYIVMSVTAINGQVVKYTLVDPKAAIPISIDAAPEEVEILKKHVFVPAAKGKKEVIRACPGCNNEMVLEENGVDYSGTCPMCNRIAVCKFGLKDGKKWLNDSAEFK